jgi:hypothetical protein
MLEARQFEELLIESHLRSVPSPCDIFRSLELAMDTTQICGVSIASSTAGGRRCRMMVR